MPSYTSVYEVQHSATDMFNLAADIQSYPEFVPLCSGMEILSKKEEDGKEVLEARMTVSAGFVKESFTNRVVLDRDNLTIAVKALDGPFNHLTNDWAFEPLGEKSCRISFKLDYEFRSFALRLTLGAISETAFGRYAKAFEDRADEIYGK